MRGRRRRGKGLVSADGLGSHCTPQSDRIQSSGGLPSFHRVRGITLIRFLPGCHMRAREKNKSAATRRPRGASPNWMCKTRLVAPESRRLRYSLSRLLFPRGKVRRGCGCVLGARCKARHPGAPRANLTLHVSKHAIAGWLSKVLSQEQDPEPSPFSLHGLGSAAIYGFTSYSSSGGGP